MVNAIKLKGNQLSGGFILIIKNLLNNWAKASHQFSNNRNLRQSKYTLYGLLMKNIP